MTTSANKSLELKAGEWVIVRSREEILATLDKGGRLDNLPFMPEMFQHCGKKLQVYKRAHKTCDTVFPIRGRRFDATVHLETRCGGEAHGGCQAGCLIFWKEAWLKRADDNAPAAMPAGRGCTEADVIAATEIADPKGGPVTYVCQATQLPYASQELSWWEMSQYVEDFTSGNASLWEVIRATSYSTFYNVSQAGIGLGPVMRWFYEKFGFLWGSKGLPRKHGVIPKGQPTPQGSLDLQPGELVRVKSHEEILKTLNTENRNRGLYFDAEMLPYCGGTYRVLTRVDKIIDEKTGKMSDMKNPCIILEGGICQARYSDCRMLCPRAIYSFWREIWLERVEEKKAPVKKQEELVQLAAQ
jgi:hypothetical protein